MQFPTIESLDRHFDDVYISPHLDDVVLSCAGRILVETKSGRSVLIVTVFTADQPEDADINPEVLARVGDMQERKAEDCRAIERLGVDFLWLDYPEAMFRSESYHTLYGVFSLLTASDLKMAASLAPKIEELCRRVQCTRLYLPLGVGNHADHRLLFETGIQVAKTPDRRYDVFFYEDAPYTFTPNLLEYRLKAARVGAALNERWRERSVWERASETYQDMIELSSVRAQLNNRFLQRLLYLFLVYRFSADTNWGRPVGPRLQLEPEMTDISAVVEAKLGAVGEYRSQIQPVLGDLETFRAMLARYSRKLGDAPAAERIWKVIG
jgi:LmbE family N-acetylglucosaminyl deacetylase